MSIENRLEDAVSHKTVEFRLLVGHSILQPDGRTIQAHDDLPQTYTLKQTYGAVPPGKHIVFGGMSIRIAGDSYFHGSWSDFYTIEVVQATQVEASSWAQVKLGFEP